MQELWLIHSMQELWLISCRNSYMFPAGTLTYSFHAGTLTYSMQELWLIHSGTLTYSFHAGTLTYSMQDLWLIIPYSYLTWSKRNNVHGMLIFFPSKFSFCEISRELQRWLRYIPLLKRPEHLFVTIAEMSTLNAVDIYEIVKEW